MDSSCILRQIGSLSDKRGTLVQLFDELTLTTNGQGRNSRRAQLHETSVSMLCSRLILTKFLINVAVAFHM